MLYPKKVISWDSLQGKKCSFQVFKWWIPAWQAEKTPNSDGSQSNFRNKIIAGLIWYKPLEDLYHHFLNLNHLNLIFQVIFRVMKPWSPSWSSLGYPWWLSCSQHLQRWFLVQKKGPDLSACSSLKLTCSNGRQLQRIQRTSNLKLWNYDFLVAGNHSSSWLHKENLGFGFGTNLRSCIESVLPPVRPC